MTSCIGVKIQARTEYFINLTVPTRDEIRRSNYLRRRAQLAGEGFHSKIWKPYVCIGNPLELDKVPEFTLSLETDARAVVVPERAPSVVETNKSVRSRKLPEESCHRKEAENFQQFEKTLKEEIRKSDQVNFNVRVGQSFFGIIHHEKEEQAKEAIEQKIKIEKDIKAPKYDSESDSENDLILEKGSSRPTTAASRGRIKSRPFTPVYNNISSLESRAKNRPKSVYSSSTHTSYSAVGDIEESSLYRQLCSLHWLLKAMVHEDAVNMPRISLSWTIKNDDNGLTSSKSRADIKIVWEKFVSKSVVPAETSQEPGHKTKMRLLANIPPVAKTSKMQPTDPLGDPYENELQTREDQGSSRPPILRRPQRRLGLSTAIWEDSSKTPQSRSTRRRVLLTQMRSVCDQLDKDGNDYDERKKLHLIRVGKMASEILRTPHSTKLLPEDHYSDKLEHMVRRNRAKSAQLLEEKAAELRENVKNMSEYKMTVCLNKYKDLQTHGPFHHMIKEFRNKNSYHKLFTEIDASRNKIIYADWFLALEDSLKDHEDNKRIERIMRKIRQFALITVTKINSHRLLAVLETLADWEIKHPEISASIKFITDHIVMISEEEYQSWFRAAFP